MCVCLGGGGGGGGGAGRVEWQSCSQHCTGRMGDVSVVCVGWGEGGRVAVVQSTLHWEAERCLVCVCVCVGGGG